MIPSSKLQKITQRLHFGYCQGVFREFFVKKCENRTAGFGLQLPGFGLVLLENYSSFISRKLIGRSPKAKARFHALYAQESDRPQDGPGFRLRLRVPGSIR